MGIFPNFRVENKTYLKPPSSHLLFGNPEGSVVSTNKGPNWNQHYPVINHFFNWLAFNRMMLPKSLETCSNGWKKITISIHARDNLKAGNGIIFRFNPR